LKIGQPAVAVLQNAVYNPGQSLPSFFLSETGEGFRNAKSFAGHSTWPYWARLGVEFFGQRLGSRQKIGYNEIGPSK
jgi:hypothetical protein